MRRAVASMSSNVRSAVASVVTGGTTVTGMPRVVASATSMFDGVMDCAATWRSFGFAAMTARSTLSCSRQNRISALRTAAISARWGIIRLSSGNTFTFASARNRLSALSAIGWLTKTRGLAVTAATARYRRPHPRRTEHRRESCGWHRARQAPSEYHARAQAKPDVRLTHRVPRPLRRPATGCG